LRIPSIVSMPGAIPQNETRDQIAVGMDWLPTIAELTGATLPPNKLDGKSIAPVIRSTDAKSPHEAIYWQLGRGKGAQWVVRSGDWKLLGNPRDLREPQSLGPDDKLFLANIRTAPDESENLAKQHPEIVEQLSKVKERYWKDVNGD